MRTEKRYKTIKQLAVAGFVFFTSICQTQIVSAQKKPTEFDSRRDDKALCSANSSFKTTEYCDFWKEYNDNRKGSAAQQLLAKNDRDELIKYVRGRIDRFYEESTNKKKFDRNLLQTVFDMLEIGAAAAIGITNGERAKEVIGIALGGIQASRTSLNKNFDLLQTRNHHQQDAREQSAGTGANRCQHGETSISLLLARREERFAGVPIRWDL